MTSDEIQNESMVLMQAAAEVVVGLSKNEECYDLPYIASQLAKCSAFGERLADFMARLAQLRVVTLQHLDRAANILEMARVEAELTEESRLMKPASLRGSWVRKKVDVEHLIWKSWKTAELVVREAKEDVGRRAEMIKRLDSDLRLHQRIIEAKITAGAMGQPDLTSGDRPGYRGGERDVAPRRRELDEDTPDDVDLS